MKTMQEFYKGIATNGELLTSDQRHLNKLTRLSPAQLADVSGQSVWWIWSVEETPDELVKQ